MDIQQLIRQESKEQEEMKPKSLEKEIYKYRNFKF